MKGSRLANGHKHTEAPVEALADGSTKLKEQFGGFLVLNSLISRLG